MLLLVSEVQGEVSTDIIGALVARNKSADIRFNCLREVLKVPAWITDCKSMLRLATSLSLLKSLCRE